MSDADPTSDVSTLTVQLLSAYLANNTVPSEQLAELIRSTKAALTDETSGPAQSLEPEQFTPAVSVRKSLASPEHIISLIDGKPYKTLKRHLASHGLTPETYRRRYNLPASYPMVAPTYADHRREVAQRLGLGRREPKAELGEEPKVPSPQESSEVEASPARTTLTQPAPAQTLPPSEKAPVKVGARKTRKGAANEQDTSSEADATATAAARPDENTATTSDAPASEESQVHTGIAAKAVPKPKPRSRKSGKQGEVASVKSEAQVSDEPDRADDDAVKTQVPERKAAKRAGKIGLFKKADAAMEAASDSAKTSAASSPVPRTSSSDQGEKGAEAPTKRRPTKRMARAPKAGGS